ncbi:hypothetical protein LINGRAPRIM_LOCUS141 [Linum grandiflorum]
MSFSTASILGSHVLARKRKFHVESRELFQTSSGRLRFGVNFNHQKKLMCKDELLVDFEERTSPYEMAKLLDCTSWTGAGPGLMDAATKGALKAGKPVGGFKIGKEAGEWTASNFHPYLPSETYITCRFFSARKHGLVDAAVRMKASDRTAVVVLPGGIGTLDEMFEILALVQLERIGSEFPVPIIVMNYDSFYKKLLEFLDDCECQGTVSKGEVPSLWKICDNNFEALAYLADFYDLAWDGI